MVMNKVRNKSFTQAMRWGRMYSRYFLEYHHHNFLLVENVNVWRVSKYHDFFCEGPIKVAHCKKIKKL
jgi:hypothetical protein